MYNNTFSDELKSLETEVNYVKDKLNTIITQANEAQELVTMVNNDSLSIYRDIYAINLPDVNVTVMKQNISTLNAEVRYIFCYLLKKILKIII